MSTADRSAPSAIINRSGPPIPVGPNQVRVLAGVETGDPIGAVEYSIAPGFAPPPVLHRHTREDAGWFVLDGAIALTFEDGETVVAGPGDSITHPRGCWFRWENASADEPAARHLLVRAGRLRAALRRDRGRRRGAPRRRREHGRVRPDTPRHPRPLWRRSPPRGRVLSGRRGRAR